MNAAQDFAWVAKGVRVAKRGETSLSGTIVSKAPYRCTPSICRSLRVSVRWDDGALRKICILQLEPHGDGLRLKEFTTAAPQGEV